MKKYFDIHVQLSRKDGDGFSVFLVANTDEINDFLDDQEIIDLAVNKGLLESNLAKKVDYVDEITEADYKEWTAAK